MICRISWLPVSVIHQQIHTHQASPSSPKIRLSKSIPTEFTFLENNGTSLNNSIDLRNPLERDISPEGLSIDNASIFRVEWKLASDVSNLFFEINRLNFSRFWMKLSWKSKAIFVLHSLIKTRAQFENGLSSSNLLTNLWWPNHDAVQHHYYARGKHIIIDHHFWEITKKDGIPEIPLFIDRFSVRYWIHLFIAWVLNLMA